MRQRILCIISFFAFMFLAVTHAQAQDIRNSSGSYMGKIESSGRVYNSSGSYSGRFDGDRVYNSSGSYIGRIESGGRVYNSSGSYIGRIESGGRIYNSSGSYIGEARGVNPQWAAAYFFFFRF